MITIKNFSLFLTLILIISSYQIFAQAESKIELVDISFTGNDYFSSSELEKVITAKETSNWLSQFLNSFSSFGGGPSYFDSLAIPNDISLLKSLYFSNGFFRTKVEAQYNIEKNGKGKASLRFIITENEPTNFYKLYLNGLGKIPITFLNKINSIVTIDSTVQYSDFAVEQNRDLVLSYLQDNGYMFVQADQPIVEIDTIYTNSVNIYMNFEIGERFKIKDVSVEKSGPGKNLVSNNLIEEIVNIKPGSYYSYHDLKLAQIRLYRTNLFSSAVITGNTADTSGGNVPIRIVTDIGLLNEIAPEILLIYDRTESTNLKLGLGLSWTNKNFFGDARKLTIGSSIAAEDITEFIKQGNLASDNIYGYADLRASVEQPFLFGKPINTKFETFYTLEKKRNEWNASIYGAKLNFNFELPAYNYLTALNTYFTWQSSKYIFKEAYLQSKLASLSDSLISSIPTTSNSKNAILGLQLVANKTDDQLFPTKGYSIALLAEDGNSIPFFVSKIGNYNFDQSAYYKLVLTSTFYFPILTNYFDAFGSKIKIGNIHSYYGNPLNIPFNQRLTAGGSNSIRGWRANDLPLIKAIKFTDFPTQAEIENAVRKITPGGFFLLEGSIEAREHLTQKIGAALFIDYGNVWNSYNQFRYDQIAVAAGFGFRYYSDFAPIRLDFGFKVHDPSTNTKFYNRKFFDVMAFHIGIGEAF
ncbi:MAG: BamA/TamA family outer membrane protein [Ignavibacteriales bacterium]|nr:BamA/TamA family outer membrane protein [Ignavibacteriales bacterium]